MKDLNCKACKYIDYEMYEEPCSNCTEYSNFYPTDMNEESITIKELLDMQIKLDNAILDREATAVTSSPEQKERLLKTLNNDLITERILALTVEASELANATRCFKYWSIKESEPKERILDEYADCLHFMLSIAHSLGFTAAEIEKAYMDKNKVNYERIKNQY